MESGALPWEASRAALDLLRRYREIKLPDPLIQECLWYWRVTLAAPDMEPDDRLILTAQLFADEASGRLSPDSLDHIATQLAYQEVRKGGPMKWAAGPGIHMIKVFLKLSQEVQSGRQRSTQKRDK